MPIGYRSPWSDAGQFALATAANQAEQERESIRRRNHAGIAAMQQIQSNMASHGNAGLGFGDFLQNEVRGAEARQSSQDARVAGIRSPYGYSPVPGIVTRGGQSNYVATPTIVPEGAMRPRPMHDFGDIRPKTYLEQKAYDSKLHENRARNRRNGYADKPDPDLLLAGAPSHLARRTNLTKEQIAGFTEKYNARKAEKEKRRQRAFSMRQAQRGWMFEDDGDVDMLGSMAAQLMGRGAVGPAVAAARARDVGGIERGRLSLDEEFAAVQKAHSDAQIKDMQARTQEATDASKWLRDPNYLAHQERIATGQAMDPLQRKQMEDMETAGAIEAHQNLMESTEGDPEALYEQFGRIASSLAGKSPEEQYHILRDIAGFGPDQLEKAAEYEPRFANREHRKGGVPWYDRPWFGLGDGYSTVPSLMEESEEDANRRLQQQVAMRKFAELLRTYQAEPAGMP